MHTPLLQVKHLYKRFTLSKTSLLTALEDICFTLKSGDVLGLVGESGSGKSTLGRILTGLDVPSQGGVLFQGKTLSSSKEARKERQMLFQDPGSSLNPKMTIAKTLQEPFKIHNLPFSPSKLQELLEQVHLSSEYGTRFPHQLSGGQKQRIALARALALYPKLLVCDEPLSALDSATAKQILELLRRVQQEHQMTMVFITHDLRSLQHLASHIAVLYLGRLMELAPAQDLYKKTLHPYTQALFSSLPIPDPIRERNRKKLPLFGDPPSPLTLIQGCAFATRCPHATPLCHTIAPAWKELSPGRFVRCHLAS
ncbi:MAG: ABC transporter ATP-binding protein [Chlamydiae bacterium]|nr:ABC transporter ATP-binding protein [Chlamydiota bacterium]